MAKRVFLHIGTPKTGTTHLQTVLWANRAKLAELGVLLPLRRVRDHYYLSSIARGKTDDMSVLPPSAQALWGRMLDEVSGWAQDALISHELFAVCSADRARWTTEQLATVSDEVHIVVTARDLSRQVPAEWQQTIKHGRSHRLREFYEDLRSDTPSVLFWRVQDLPAVLSRWESGLPAERLHIVTVPPPEEPRDLLLDRFATLLGVDPTSLDRSASSPNESLGVEEVEMLRRVNLHAPEEEDAPKRQLLIKQVLADSILAARPDAQKFAPPPEEQPWVVERGTAMVAALRAASYDVVGDLDELVPPLTTPDGADPDDVDDSAVARVAVETMAAVLYRSHELEAQRLTTQVASLKQRLEVRNSRVETLEQRAKTLDQRAKTLGQRAKTLGQRVKTLEQQLQTARQAFRDERAQPLSVHLRRRAGLVKRRLVRQPPP